MDKNELRKKYKKIRDSISNKEAKEKRIIENLIHEEIYKQAKTIALYSSINSEVGTNLFASICKKDNKTLAYPRVIKENEMLFFKISKLEELEEGTFHIKEPKNNIENLIPKEEIDLMIIPGLCFDTNKNRIGYGKGYYDNYLKDSKIIKVGICFDAQITKEKIEANKNDIKMDYIITENRIY